MLGFGLCYCFGPAGRTLLLLWPADGGYADVRAESLGPRRSHALMLMVPVGTCCSAVGASVDTDLAPGCSRRMLFAFARNVKVGFLVHGRFCSPALSWPLDYLLLGTALRLQTLITWTACPVLCPKQIMSMLLLKARNLKRPLLLNGSCLSGRLRYLSLLMCFPVVSL